MLWRHEYTAITNSTNSQQDRHQQLYICHERERERVKIQFKCTCKEFGSKMSYTAERCTGDCSCKCAHCGVVYTKLSGEKRPEHGHNVLVDSSWSPDQLKTALEWEPKMHSRYYNMIDVNVFVFTEEKVCLQSTLFFFLWRGQWRVWQKMMGKDHEPGFELESPDVLLYKMSAHSPLENLAPTTKYTFKWKNWRLGMIHAHLILTFTIIKLRFSPLRETLNVVNDILVLLLMFSL